MKLLREQSSQPRQVIDGKERSPLDEVLRQGARQMLVKAVEAEVTAYIETHQHEVATRTAGGFRNGHGAIVSAATSAVQAPEVSPSR